MNYMRTIAARLDDWTNLVTGFGTSRDKTMSGYFAAGGDLADDELSALYHEDDTAARVVDLLPREMFREGFEVSIQDDPEAVTAVNATLKSLGAADAMLRAMIWGRLYGGTALLIGADDGRPADAPLVPEAVRSVDFLHVITRRSLTPRSRYRDLKDPKYGKPEVWTITNSYGGPIRLVHDSRLIMFGGALTDDERRYQRNGFDHSILQKVYPVLRQFNSNWKAAEHLMSDANQAVFKIKGLMAMIAGGRKADLQTRMQLVDMSRSVARAVMLDTDNGEDFHRDTTQFAGVSDMLDKACLRLAAAAEVPVTVLMGQSPAGLNATGASDVRIFYDTIAARQETDLKPKLEHLIALILTAQGKHETQATITFRSLWQESPQEQAIRRKTVAETDAIYAGIDVLTPEEIAESRFRADGWSAETTIDLEARKAAALPIDVGKSLVTPTDVASIATVNEARAAEGLPALPEPEGSMTVATYAAQGAAEGAATGKALGDVKAEEIAPAEPVPAALQAAPEDAPASDDDEEEDAPEEK